MPCALGIVGPVAMLGLSTQWGPERRAGPGRSRCRGRRGLAARLSERGITAAEPGGARPGPGRGRLARSARARHRCPLGPGAERQHRGPGSCRPSGCFPVGRPRRLRGGRRHTARALISRVDRSARMSVHDASGLSCTSCRPGQGPGRRPQPRVKGTVPADQGAAPLAGGGADGHLGDALHRGPGPRPLPCSGQDRLAQRG